MLTSRIKQDHQSPSWQWYLLGATSAVIMGISSFVIAFNFMLGQVPMLLAISCALSGLILNTLLYWQDSAKKLQRFVEAVTTEPQNLFSFEALLSLGSALCVGFLAFSSYQTQISSLSSTLLAAIPYTTIIVLLSFANSISTFVLFYDLPTSKTPLKDTPSNHSSLITHLVDIIQRPLHVHCAYVLGATQSILFTMTNLYCVRQILNFYMPFAVIANTAIAGTLALALVISEIRFNCSNMEKFVNTGLAKPPQTIDLRWRDLLMSMVTMNAFANGYIALGTLQHLPYFACWSIVAIGSIVSFAVMQEPVASIYQLVDDFKSERARFIPDNQYLSKIVDASLKMLGCLAGLYLFEPAALIAAISAYPLMVGILSGAFTASAFLTLGGDSIIMSIIHGTLWPQGKTVGDFPGIPVISASTNRQNRGNYNSRSLVSVSSDDSVSNLPTELDTSLHG